MRALFSPTQALHAEKTKRLFLSPEAKALRTDAEIGEIQELALLDHLFSGWRNLNPRYSDAESKQVVIRGENGEIIREGGVELPGLGFVPDDKIKLDEAELLEAQIAEVKNALSNKEVIEGYKQLSPEDREYISELIDKHIFASDIGEIGGLGTKNRTFPLNYEIVELRGQKIPVNFAPGQKYARGKKLILDVAEGVDPDTGVPTHGVNIDAMHRVPAAKAPEKVADIDNIKMGATAMNQADGRRTGEKLVNSRQKRLLNLQDKLFFAEHGVPNKWRGGLDKQTRDDLAINRKMTDEDRKQEYAQRLLEQRINEISPLIKTERINSKRDNQDRAIIINSGGGDVTVGENALRKNGNGYK